MFIHEHPFAWRPPQPWGPRAHANRCVGEHLLADAAFGAVTVVAWTRCLWFRVADQAPLFSNRVNRPYDPAAMELSVVWAGPADEQSR